MKQLTAVTDWEPAVQVAALAAALGIRASATAMCQQSRQVIDK